MEIPFRAMRAVVDYNWHDELRDFEEMERMGEDTSAHVFTFLREIDAWLESEGW